MEELDFLGALYKFIANYLPTLAVILTAGFIAFKLSKTKGGQDFIRYLGSESQKDLNKRICEHETRLNSIDRRLEKGDIRFDTLAKEIKQGDLTNKEQLGEIKEDVKMILKTLLNGKDD